MKVSTLTIKVSALERQGLVLPADKLPIEVSMTCGACNGLRSEGYFGMPCMWCGGTGKVKVRLEP